MDIRQFDVYIDGHKLPRWFLTDADTQFGQRTNFEFDGYMRRLQPDGEPPASPHHDDLFAPHVSPFAELGGRVLGFRLRETDEGGRALRLISRSTNTNMHWKARGAGNELHEFIGGGVWELEWGETYVLFVDYYGARSQMTLKAVRVRLALRDMSRALLNRV